MPEVRPFRALRYEPEIVGDLGAVVSPPYDVISPAAQLALLARHPKNVVRLDLPSEEPGDEPDDRYRRAARTFAAWRSDGTFRKDPHPSVYAYEQTYRLPGTSAERAQRGFFGRLRLEPLGQGGGVLPHERTLAGPREDRYKLLRATGANFSPVVGLFGDASGTAAAALASIAQGNPTIELTDDDGVHHRLWVVQADGEPDELPRALLTAAGAAPITIADGHHRYETALRYRDERRMSRSCEEDPPFDYILALLLDATDATLTVLPTHRVISGLGDDGVEALWAHVGELFVVGRVERFGLDSSFDAADLAPGGDGRFGLWTRHGGAHLVARREAFEGLLPSGGTALRRLDVSLLQAALDRLCGIDPGEAATGDRIAYTKSAAEAMDWVDAGSQDADAAFLLEPTPVEDVMAVAAQGDVMPQKSTYFYPKPLSGLVINPHDW